MDFENLLKFLSQYSVDYFEAFIAILKKPTIQFPPINAIDGKNSIIHQSRDNYKLKEQRFNPKLFVFVTTSILIGSIINVAIPNKNVRHELSTIFVFVLIFWFFYGYFIHWVSRLIGGSGTIIQTISSTFQLLAVIYVISNFVALIAGIAISISQVNSFLVNTSSTGKYLANNPIVVFIVVQFILLLFYLPRSLTYVHQFGWKKQGAILTTILLGLIVWILMIIPFTVTNFVDCTSGSPLCGG